MPHPVTPLGAVTTGYLQVGGWFVNNAGWVSGAELLVLVDTCATEARTVDLLAAARRPAETPVAAVITHAHGDHANGAGLVTRAGGRVLAAPAAAEEIGSGPHTAPAVFHCADWGDITPPDTLETVAAPVTLHTGAARVDVVPVPTAAHTTGDLVAWVPDDGVLFTGDLVFHGATPLALSGSVAGWVAALRWLTDFDARTIVPGHGPVCGPQKQIDVLCDYFGWLLDTVSTQPEPDYPALEHRARQRWPRWTEPERHAVNLRLAHAETHGYPLDETAAMTAMVASAGGPITLHL